MPGRDGRGPAGTGFCGNVAGTKNGNSGSDFLKNSARPGTGRSGRGICRRVSFNETASDVLHIRDEEIEDLKRQAEILKSSLDKINLKIKELDSKE
jgi:hypothetical protein